VTQFCGQGIHFSPNSPLLCPSPTSCVHYLQTLSSSQNPFLGSQAGKHSAPEAQKKGYTIHPTRPWEQGKAHHLSNDQLPPPRWVI
jgi:hypothetical protein